MGFAKRHASTVCSSIAILLPLQSKLLFFFFLFFFFLLLLCCATTAPHSNWRRRACCSDFSNFFSRFQARAGRPMPLASPNSPCPVPLAGLENRIELSQWCVCVCLLRQCSCVAQVWRRVDQGDDSPAAGSQCSKLPPLPPPPAHCKLVCADSLTHISLVSRVSDKCSSVCLFIYFLSFSFAKRGQGPA